MMFQVFWTEFLPIIVLWEESNKIFLRFNFFVSFLDTHQADFYSTLLTCLLHIYEM